MSCFIVLGIFSSSYLGQLHAVRCHRQEKVQLEYDLQRLRDFKAAFENLAESSVDDSESVRHQIDGDDDGDGGVITGDSLADCGDGKWKLRAKKLQKYVEWQLAEAETQVQHALAKYVHHWTIFVINGCELGNLL